ncbi:MAG TPA: dTMP kinase [Anaerolineaceae bacterium]|nr:dTMP kinase [Anaerolineaceae bacterium]
MFITLEGPDGSGKTSQISSLAEFLTDQGYRVLTTREPGGTEIGGQIRQILLNDARNTGMTTRTEILLFLAARAQIVEEVIRPHLSRGGLVLSDRFGDSTLAYQGYGHGTDIDTLRQLLAFATGGLKPDLTLLLDLDVVEGLTRRRSGGGEWNRLDAYPLEFHERVRAGYLRLAAEEPERWVIVDAARPSGQIQRDLRAIVSRRLEEQSIRL